MAIPTERKSRDQAAYIESTKDSGTDRRVNDGIGHDKLDSIISALGGATGFTRTTFNVTLGPANTEQSQVLPATTGAYLIRSRGSSELKISFSAGTSGTLFITIPRHATFVDDNPTPALGLTIYFQSPQTGDTIEILTWS